MILHALYELYGRLAKESAYQIAPPGYSPQKISFKVVLHPDGKLHEIQDARVQQDKKLRPDLRLMPGKGKPSGSGINPCFLWDNSGYMLGFKPDDPKPERSLKTFEAFKDKHLRLESVVNQTSFSAICRFLESWDPAKAEEILSEVEVGTGFGMFELLGGGRIHEEKAIDVWWQSQMDTEPIEPDGQCLISGELAQIANLQPKIKGVMGAQSAGASLVSFNAKSYESYGLEQAYNAPVGKDAAFRYGVALNALLNGPKSDSHRIIVGDSTTVFWTGESSPIESAFGCFFSHGSEVQDEDLRQSLEVFIKALRHGKEAIVDLANPEDTFYILGLAPNAARLSVRFYHQSTVADFIETLRKHYADMQIVRQFDETSKKPDPEFPATWQLLRETARESKEIPPLLSGALMRAVLTGHNYPEFLLAFILRRIRADRKINYLRASVIKGVLVRNHHKEISMALDPDNPDIAYRLGRLFATLEKTQKDGLGEKLNATIRDRFFSSASANPRAVFPRLIRTYQHHLARIENVGARVNREKLMQEIFDTIGPPQGFPAHLNMEQQGMFAIGYYHQTKAFYTKNISETTKETSI